MTYRTTVCLSGVLAALALSAPAHAQSSGAQAETLFRQGKDLLAKGQIAEACAAFDASQKLDPNIATLLNQAACREKNGQLATAWGLFLDAERQTRNATDAQNQGHHQILTFIILRWVQAGCQRECVTGAREQEQRVIR